MLPVFSNSHLRDMSHIFYNVSRKVSVLRLCCMLQFYSECRVGRSRQMCSALASRMPKDGNSKVLDMNLWMARTTLEILGQAGLGYSFDNFVEDSTDPFGESLKMFLYVLTFNSSTLSLLIADFWRWSPVYGPWQFYLSTLAPLTHIFSDAFIKRVLRLIPIRSLKRLLQISDTMHEHSSRIVAERRVALRKGDEVVLQEVGEGRDIMSVCRTSLSLSTSRVSVTALRVWLSQSRRIWQRRRRTGCPIMNLLRICRESFTVFYIRLSCL